MLKSDPRNERRQWAVAHEIGEHAAHRVFNRFQIDPSTTSPNAREMVANQMAGRLLLPTRWFESLGRQCQWDLLTLKMHFHTASHELIARRMLECCTSIIISIFDQGCISWRRSNMPGRTPSPSAQEIACWRKIHENNRAFRISTSSQNVRGWPVHEEGWTREILRTEVEEIADLIWDS